MTAWDYYAWPIGLNELKNLNTEEYKHRIKEGSVFVKDLDGDREDYTELCLWFLKYSPWGSLEYIDNPTHEMKMLACGRNGHTIKVIPEEERTEELQLLSVRHVGDALGHITNPSEEVKLAAVSQNGNAIRYIEEPTEAIQLAAVKQRPSVFRYIKKPTEKTKILAASLDADALDYIEDGDITYEMAVAAVSKYGRKIKDVPKKWHTEELKLIAVKRDAHALECFENPAEEMLWIYYNSYIKPQIKN